MKPKLKKNTIKGVKENKITPRFFTEPRATICRILIEELTQWESTEKCTTEEILRLVDRLSNITPIKVAKNKVAKK